MPETRFFYVLDHTTYAPDPGVRDWDPYAQRIVVQLRDGHETLEKLTRIVYDFTLANGDEPRFLIVDVRTYLSLKHRHMHASTVEFVGFATQVLCGDFLSDDIRVVVVASRDEEHGLRILRDAQRKEVENTNPFNS